MIAGTDMRYALTALLLATGTPVEAAQMSATAPLQQSSRSDEGAILAAINALFAALEVRDEARVGAAVIPDGLVTSVRVDGDAQPRSRNWHWNRYYANIAAQERFSERMVTSEVLVERDIATVWGRYELHIEGVFRQCGVNHFGMVRTGGKWMIYNLTRTNQTVGCPGR